MDYPYANGVIKAIEGKLVDRARASKLARTDKAGFLKALGDLGYGRVQPGDTVETVIAREMRDFHQMLDGLTPDRKATDLFFLMEDAINIKVLLKRKHFGAPAFDDAATDGSFLFPALERAILSNDVTDLPPPLAALLARISAGLRDADAATLSAVVDRELFGYAFRVAGPFANEALKTYLRAKADFANVLAMLRMRRLGWPVERFQATYVPGGLYAADLFVAAFAETPTDAARRFQDAYDEKVSAILRDVSEKKTLADAETKLNDLLVAVVAPFRHDGFAIGPIVFYHLEKQREADLIRSLYARAEDRPAD